MSDKALDQEKLEKKLWKEIDQQKIGMLGIVGGAPRHMQPMTGFCDRDRRAIWFFTRRDADLAKDVGDQGQAAMFCFMDKDRELWACLGGDLTIDDDRARIDENWSPVVAAWYPDGKDDAQLTLLRFEVVDAQVWLSAKGPMRFAYEIARANATRTLPDVGGKAELRFQ